MKKKYKIVMETTDTKMVFLVRKKEYEEIEDKLIS
jgi:hypothetical protein